jgi:hypothetical protein
MGRNEELVYSRGDVLYMAGGTIAAIGDTLEHRWARYISQNFWENELKKPEVVEARTEWLREAYKFIQELDWREFLRLMGEGAEKLPELRSALPEPYNFAERFHLKGNTPEEIYSLVAVIGHTTASQSTYLDLVMHTDPIVRRLAWEEGKEPLPPPLSWRAETALEKGVLGFLVKHTYASPYETPGINRPDVTVKYAKEYEERGAQDWARLERPPIPDVDTVERNIEYLRYEHTTGTGRGEFSVSYGDGVYDFHFRVVRGGEYAGLTAIETHVRIADKDLHKEGIKNGISHMIAYTAQERHYIFAADILSDIAKNMEKYGAYAADVPYQIHPAAEKIEILAEIIKEEYEVKFGPFPEKDQDSFYI